MQSLLSGSSKKSIQLPTRDYMAFSDLEKAFYRVPRKVIWMDGWMDILFIDAQP